MLLPKEAIDKVIATEVFKTNNLIARLKGLREYPIEVNLKVPSANAILKDINIFQEFVRQWREFKHQELVERIDVNFKLSLPGNNLPSKFVIHNFNELLMILKRSDAQVITTVIERCEKLAHVMYVEGPNPFYDLYKDLTETALSNDDFGKLLVLLPQLKKGMGKDLYLRALPVEHIDTKYIETHDKLIYDILYKSFVIITENSLNEFLGVIEKPLGMVHLRVLDDSLVDRYDYVMLPASQLQIIEPQGEILFVVENVQSGFALPKIKNASVVFGCGNNLAWADNEWIANKKQVIYWGDLDSWGFKMLQDFRLNSKVKVDSMLMDLKTIQTTGNEKKMVHEIESFEFESFVGLSEKEIEALKYLQSLENNRFEQEKLDSDLIYKAIEYILK